MRKKTAVYVCPGRGTYNKSELGYLHKYHSDLKSIFDQIDDYRKVREFANIWELDGEKAFSSKAHLWGINSSALIFASSYADYLKINREKFEIVAITGNSMGWYTACICAGALSFESGNHLIHTMSAQVKDEIIGGQIIYPTVHGDWTPDLELISMLEKKMEEVNLRAQHQVFNSIYFGGYRIIGGNELGLKALLNELPPCLDIYPFRLVGNGAFHTPLFSEISQKVRRELTVDVFQKFKIPLIDGRGKIWSPYSANLVDIWDYTLGDQVDKPYDFSAAINIAVKEFAPDYIILGGPGMTLGGAVGQVLIQNNLKSFTNKESFKKLQSNEPYILAMGDESQRNYVVNI
jgi:[acyl-carrier-protein] S-malonyltransferase